MMLRLRVVHPRFVLMNSEASPTAGLSIAVSAEWGNRERVRVSELTYFLVKYSKL